MYCGKHWRKATDKEKRIMEKLKRKVNSNPNKLKVLITAKEIWLDKLRGNIVKMERCRERERDKAMKIISIFQKDEGNSTRKQMRDQHTKDKYQQWINL